SLNEGRSVALETVFSDQQGYKLALLEEARNAGFATVLVFIGIDSAELSKARVMERAAGGGHDVDDAVIEQRFPRCFENLKKGMAIADLTVLIDNTGSYEGGPRPARHYQFAVVERGVGAEVSQIVPDWYRTFGIADAIAAISRAEKDID